MLVMKAWLETRWRFVTAFALPLLVLALNYQNHNSPVTSLRAMFVLLGLALALGSMLLGGSGVKSQAPFGFPEGLVGSTQFTISLPVSRLRLLSVRAGIGLLEMSVVTVIIGCLTWGLFPGVRASAMPADLPRILLTAILFLTGPYFASVFFWTFLDDPLPGQGAGLTMTLLLVLSNYVPAPADIFRAWGQASPLFTHRLPWSQMAVSVILSAILFLAAVRIVQTREY